MAECDDRLLECDDRLLECDDRLLECDDRLLEFVVLFQVQCQDATPGFTCECISNFYEKLEPGRCVGECYHTL